MKYLYLSILATILFSCSPKTSQKAKSTEEVQSKGIDTIVFFKPDVIDEFVIIINHDTGKRDTIRVIDLD